MSKRAFFKNFKNSYDPDFLNVKFYFIHQFLVFIYFATIFPAP